MASSEGCIASSSSTSQEADQDFSLVDSDFQSSESPDNKTAKIESTTPLVNGTSKAKKKEKLDNTSDSPKIIKVNDSAIEDGTPTIKRNAFELMMNSRHSVIGRNSPGKEIQDEDDDEVQVTEKKSALSARKKLLENWSDAKGASKRKREYEETGKTIVHKLDKRAKRMKTLLKIGDKSESEKEVITKRKRNRRRKNAVKSDTDDSSDFVLSPKTANEKIVKLNSTFYPKKKENLLIEAWKMKIALKMDVQQEKEELEQKQETNNVVVKVEHCDEKEVEIEVDEEKSPEPEIITVASPETSIIKVEDDLTMEEPIVGRVENCNGEEFETRVVEKLPEIQVKKEKRSVGRPRGRPRKSKMKIEYCSAEEFETEITEKLPEAEVKKQKRSVGRPRKSKISPESDLLEKEPMVGKVETCTVEEKPLETGEIKRVLRPRRSKILVDSSDEEVAETPQKDSVKLAPIFLKNKSTSKPKLDPKVAEARREFLHSGMPSSYVKERNKLQERLEEVEYDVFPVISHVQQKTDSKFWNLPKVSNLELSPVTSLIIAPLMEFKSYKLVRPDKMNGQNHEKHDVNSKSCKALVKEIKDRNPDYPVFKVFKILREKSGYFQKKPCPKVSENHTSPRKRGRPRKIPEIVPDLIELPQLENDSTISGLMWTEKYRPDSSSDIFGNKKSTESLKKWLEGWSNLKKSNDSESDFEISSDSRDSSSVGKRGNCNTVVITGPSGSGKSATIYAICHELGFEVLEINASSKRTGKKLLAEVQEATQSHQVKKKDRTLSANDKNTKHGKMCAILIEDVDLVFDQDDGFISALSQIISTSKRPIILTTNDKNSNHIQKFINQNRIIEFKAPSLAVLDVWLQILCLLEGVSIDKDVVREIMIVFRGDMRKILHQLQFYATSVKADDTVPCNFDKSIFRRDNYKKNDLNLLWWNLPRLLNLKDYSKTRLDNNKDLEFDQIQSGDGKKDMEEKTKNLKELESVFQIYDTLSCCDTLQAKKFEILDYKTGRYRSGLKDGLSLQENRDLHKDQATSADITDFLISGTLKSYNNGKEIELDHTLPNHTEIKWLSKRKMGEDTLQQALQPVNYLDSKSIYLDYVPTLRLMARLENDRASFNTKRNNRFFNYLRNLGVRTENVNCKLACDVFQT